MAEAESARFLVVASDADGTRVALPAERVRALAPVPALTRVPGAPAALAGLAERRGTALPVLDLARLLGAGSTPAGRMVLAEAGEPVGLLVARVVGLAAEPGGAALLDLPGLVARLLPRRTEAADPATSRNERATPPDAPRAAIPLLALTVAGRAYALPLGAVEAVTRLPDGAASDAMPWQGRSLPLLHLATGLGLGPAPGKRVAVLGGIGLVAERVGPVLRVRPDAIDPVPRALRRDGPAAGFVRLDDGTLVCLLSPQALIPAGTPEPDRPPATIADIEPMVVIDLAGSAYGLPAGAVRGVQRAPESLMRVPGAADGLAGMLAMRGGAVPVLDLRRRLGLPPGGEGDRRRLVVVEAGGARAGLLVDGATRLVRPEAGAIRPAVDGTDAVTRLAELPGDPCG
ncbi:chemotaxis protein CheW [Methylobacterium aquaticum]|uniref:chemotaxis protein CheW n=1 Tax=Methylobacterium aquaticum TaxID=270351 RepID=UPI001934743A|nr:chemotaxis protein CheW [Methylobacterium aquaticum]QRE73172.1 chemotaxis protein CheW [Methylobacterium aquaticum]